MTTSSETVRVVSAMELTYQMMRRLFTGCIKWDTVLGSELPRVLEDHLIAASAGLGKSNAEHDDNSDAMRAFNAATHWKERYEAIRGEVVAIAQRGYSLDCELIPLRKYEKKKVGDLSSIYFLADSAIRWANQSDLCAQLADDIDILEIPREFNSSPDDVLPTYRGPELAQYVLADLIRQLIFSVDPAWRPGQPPRSGKAADLVVGKRIRQVGVARAIVPKNPAAEEVQSPVDTVRGHIRDVLPLVQGTGNAKDRGAKALPGFYRTIAWATEAIARKQQEALEPWPPEGVLDPNRELPLVRVDQLRDCLIEARKHRLK